AINGHVYPQLESADLGASAAYRQRKLLYRNLGDGTFREVTERAPVLLERKVSRGLAAGDLDRDGRLELVVNDLDGRAQVLRNELEDPGSWLVAELVGSQGNRDAIGGVVTVGTGELTQTRLVRSGASYLSQNAMARHFGLGSTSRVDGLAVRWPDGSRSRMENLPADRYFRIFHPGR
ncbi:MAG: CRTAC1 family protein, partial [Thermoanaerobaculia bacterium]|nr:CRTAC1 family protein [Thermoanaerobaculia bacterium]